MAGLPPEARPFFRCKRNEFTIRDIGGFVNCFSRIFMKIEENKVYFFPGRLTKSGHMRYTVVRMVRAVRQYMVNICAHKI